MGNIYLKSLWATFVELWGLRWNSTTPQWPIMSAILHGVSRDQLMARHKANHIQVAYAPSVELADKALAAKAGLFVEMGLIVHLCGEINIG